MKESMESNAAAEGNEEPLTLPSPLMKGRG
jgi:hypothetical protein